MTTPSERIDRFIDEHRDRRSVKHVRVTIERIERCLMINTMDSLGEAEDLWESVKDKFYGIRGLISARRNKLFRQEYESRFTPGANENKRDEQASNQN